MNGGWARETVSKGRLTLLGTVLVVGLGAVVVVRTLDAGTVSSTVRGADPRLLGAAIVAYALSWPVRGRRYGDVVTAMGRRCDTGFLTAAVFASQTANLVIPARAGDGLRAYLLKERRAVPYPVGVASLAVERAFDLAALAAIGGLAWLSLGGRGTVSGIGTTVAAAVAGTTVVLSATTVGIARSDRRFAPAVRRRVADTRLRGLGEGLIRTGAGVRAVATTPRALAGIGAWSLAVWSLDALTAVLVLAASVGSAVPGWQLAAAGTLAVGVGNLAKVLPLSQGGIGLYEAAFTGVVVGLLPVSPETALAASILDHALKNLLTLVGGIPSAVLFGPGPGSAVFLGQPK